MKNNWPKLRNIFVVFSAFLIYFMIVGCGTSSRGSGIGRPARGKVTSNDGNALAQTAIIFDISDTSNNIFDSITSTTNDLGEYELSLPEESILAITVRIIVNNTEAITSINEIPASFSKAVLDFTVNTDEISIINSNIEFIPEEPLITTPSTDEKTTTAPEQDEIIPLPTTTPTIIPTTTNNRRPNTPSRRPTSTPTINAPINNQVPPPTPTLLPTKTPTPIPVQRVFKSCLEHFQSGNRRSGIYKISINNREINAFCDMATDGGGWTLILNYLHKSGTGPDLNYRSDSLPVQSSTALGVNESETSAWGHATPSILRNLNINEIRFFCRSSGSSEIYRGPAHFKTNLSGCINYAKTGRGTCQGVENSFQPLSGHTTGGLPTTSDNNENSRNEGDNALLDHTFVQGNNDRYWNIGMSTRDIKDWDCNDRFSSTTTDTHHQVWIR